jgi:hypothetical protein
MTSNMLLAGMAFFAVVILLVALSEWSRRRAVEALKRWAHAKGFEIISARRRSFVPTWQAGRGYQFFRIAVRDKHGTSRRAWIRCLDFNSAEPENIEITWDDETPRTSPV